MWNFIPQILGFVVFLISSFAETNRLPFDLPEAESELVAGFHTEYSAMRFALFFHGGVLEHGGALGARGDALLRRLDACPVVHLTGWLGAIVGLSSLVAKIAICMAVFVWVRWTFPRFRYDQLMRLGWKVLLPLAIVEPDPGRGDDARGLALGPRRTAADGNRDLPALRRAGARLRDRRRGAQEVRCTRRSPWC